MKTKTIRWIQISILLLCVLGIVLIWEFGFNFKINKTTLLDGIQTDQTHYLNLENDIASFQEAIILLLKLEQNIKDYFISIDNKYLVAFERHQTAFQDTLSRQKGAALTQIDKKFHLYLTNNHKILSLVKAGQKGEAMILSRSKQKKLSDQIINQFRTLIAETNKDKQEIHQQLFMKTDKRISLLNATLKHTITRTKLISYLLFSIFIVAFLIYASKNFINKSGKFLSDKKKEMFYVKRRVIMKNNGRYPTLPLETYKKLGIKSYGNDSEEV